MTARPADFTVSNPEATPTQCDPEGFPRQAVATFSHDVAGAVVGTIGAALDAPPPALDQLPHARGILWFQDNLPGTRTVQVSTCTGTVLAMHSYHAAAVTDAVRADLARLLERECPAGHHRLGESCPFDLKAFGVALDTQVGLAACLRADFPPAEAPALR